MNADVLSEIARHDEYGGRALSRLLKMTCVEWSRLPVPKRGRPPCWWEWRGRYQALLAAPVDYRVVSRWTSDQWRRYMRGVAKRAVSADTMHALHAYMIYYFRVHRARPAALLLAYYCRYLASPACWSAMRTHMRLVGDVARLWSGREDHADICDALLAGYRESGTYDFTDHLPSVIAERFAYSDFQKQVVRRYGRVGGPELLRVMGVWRATILLTGTSPALLGQRDPREPIFSPSWFMSNSLWHRGLTPAFLDALCEANLLRVDPDAFFAYFRLGSLPRPFPPGLVAVMCWFAERGCQAPDTPELRALLPPDAAAVVIRS
jgi:hypothetical protein